MTGGSYPGPQFTDENMWAKRNRHNHPGSGGSHPSPTQQYPDVSLVLTESSSPQPPTLHPRLFRAGRQTQHPALATPPPTAVSGSFLMLQASRCWLELWVHSALQVWQWSSLWRASGLGPVSLILRLSCRSGSRQKQATSLNIFFLNNNFSLRLNFQASRQSYGFCYDFYLCSSLLCSYPPPTWLPHPSALCLLVPFLKFWFHFTGILLSCFPLLSFCSFYNTSCSPFPPLSHTHLTLNPTCCRKHKCLSF